MRIARREIRPAAVRLLSSYRPGLRRHYHGHPVHNVHSMMQQRRPDSSCPRSLAVSASGDSSVGENQRPATQCRPVTAAVDASLSAVGGPAQARTPAPLPRRGGAGAGQERRRAFARHDRPWTLGRAPGGPVRPPARAVERAGNSEPDVVVPVCGGVPVAVGGAEVPPVVVPGAAAHHALTGGRSGPPGTDRTTRPERWPGAGAGCSHARRGGPTRPPATGSAPRRVAPRPTPAAPPRNRPWQAALQEASPPEVPSRSLIEPCFVVPPGRVEWRHRSAHPVHRNGVGEQGMCWEGESDACRRWLT